MPKLRPCTPSKHLWKPTKDPNVEKCEICKDQFPCRSASCGHVDCHEARKEPLPYGLTFDISTNSYRNPEDL